MPANPIDICLKNITDYFDFESLMSEFMILEGYKKIIPLGGFQDRGRDAIHIDEKEKTVFCYSVREDALVKLREDCRNIVKNEVETDKVVFCTTSSLTAAQFDKAIEEIKNGFGWEAEIYDRKRIKGLLATDHSDLIAEHPGIFNPAFFRDKTYNKDKAIYFIYGEENRFLGEWLMKKLLLEGYYCYNEDSINLIHHSNPTEHEVINNLVSKVIVIYDEALKSSETLYTQYLVAKSKKSDNPNFLYHCVSHESDLKNDLSGQDLKIDKSENWDKILSSILKQLKSEGFPKEDAKSSYLFDLIKGKESTVIEEEEDYYTNYLEVESLPKLVLEIKAEEKLFNDDIVRLIGNWAFRKINSSTFLSLEPPPPSLFKKDFRVQNKYYVSQSQIRGIDSKNLLRELIYKSINTYCQKKGLKYCGISKLIYFDHQLLPKSKIHFELPNGDKTYVQTSGMRTYNSAGNKIPYQYFLAPNFNVRFEADRFRVYIQPRYRLSDENNKALEGRTYVSRRKHLTKFWFNHHWFMRYLGIVEFLKSDEDEIKILSSEELVLNSNINSFSFPKSIVEKDE